VTRNLPAALALASLSAAVVPAQPRVDVLQAVGSLPAHIAASFAEPVAYRRSPSGDSYVFDRQSHAVYQIARGAQQAERIVEIGQEPGRILRPGAFDMAPNGTFVVADAPNQRERVQIFSPSGERLGGFTLPGRTAPRVTIGGFILNGVSSLDYTGRSILVNQPERDTLVTEYGLSGTAVRTFGHLRQTGHEDDSDVHVALNVGLPLANPKGGFYFVFQTGRPMFRKYDADGNLVFERHIEGPELDPIVTALPTRWPTRSRAEGRLPLVPPSIRTATVDPDGGLWVGLTLPYVYQYGAEGEKLRTIQLRGAGIIAPTGLHFTAPHRLLVTPGCYEFDTRRASDR
jgi:hypothetical protein